MTGTDPRRCPHCNAPVRARTALAPETAHCHPCGCRLALATDGGTPTAAGGYTREATRYRDEIARLAGVHAYTTPTGDRTPTFRHPERVQVVATLTDHDPEHLYDDTHVELNARLAAHCEFPAPDRAHLTATELAQVRDRLQATYPAPTPTCPECDRLTTPESSRPVTYPDGDERAVCEPCLTARECDAALAFTDDGIRLLPPADPSGQAESPTPDDQLRPDGGSAYVRPTGAGYLSVHRVGTKSCELHLGQAPVDWPAGTQVPAIETERGVALLPPDATPPNRLTTVRLISHTGTGTYATLPDAVRMALNVTAGADVRLYERTDGPGLLLVPAASDPLCDQDGAGDP